MNVQEDQSSKLLDQAGRRWNVVRGLRAGAVISTLILLVLFGVFLYGWLNPTIDTWGDVSYHETVKWYHLVLSLVFTGGLSLVFFWFESAYDDDYTRVYSGTVVGRFQETEGSLFSTTTRYYLVVDGYTRAGEQHQCAMTVNATYWSQQQIGDIVHLTE